MVRGWARLATDKWHFDIMQQWTLGLGTHKQHMWWPPKREERTTDIAICLFKFQEGEIIRMISIQPERELNTSWSTEYRERQKSLYLQKHKISRFSCLIDYPHLKFPAMILWTIHGGAVHCNNTEFRFYLVKKGFCLRWFLVQLCFLNQNYQRVFDVCCSQFIFSGSAAIWLQSWVWLFLGVSLWHWWMDTLSWLNALSASQEYCWSLS